jgi:hypothetical protein
MIRCKNALQRRFRHSSMSMALTSFSARGRHAPLPSAAACAALAATLFCAAPASARVITCSFTEPFVRTFYDPARKTLTIVQDVERRKQVQRDIAGKNVSKAIMELRNDKAEIVQRLEHSFQGSDGMSDKSYPYAVQWTPRDPHMPETLNGGCE